MIASTQRSSSVEVQVYRGPGLAEIQPRIESFDDASAPGHLSQSPMMLGVLQQGLRHTPYVLAASDRGRIVGYLALAHVKSLIFGRFLVSLPYVNTAGVVAVDGEVARKLIDRSVQLADELGVRYLELRHERPIEHPALSETMTSKVHMRLDLPKQADQLWDRFHCKVRNRVRQGLKKGFTLTWGREDVLPDFYRVFSENMRDLGTPVYSPRLFASLLRQSGDRAEICITRDGSRVLAVALLLHGRGVTEVPSASSLKRYNHTNANSFMYWNLLVRAIERGQDTFDFGRSSVGGGTYCFKKQWGAVEAPAAWQYYLRDGNKKPVRPENEGFQALVKAWRRLPLCVANTIGPAIVRGIP